MRCPRGVSLLAVTLAVALAAHAQSSSPDAGPGSVIRVDSLGTVPAESLATFAAPLAGNLRVGGAVRLLRVVYRTTLRGQVVPASGLLVLPTSNDPPRGVVLFLHGTNVTRALAPSQPDRVDGNEEAAVFGSNGYVVVAPDYLGLGESTVPQPYMIADAQRDASIHMLVAVRSLFEQHRQVWNPTLLLLGFSQGGHSVAAVQRELEQHPLTGYRVRGAVAVAGAFALRRVTLPYALANNGTAYLALTVTAYCRYYGRSLHEAFTPELAAALPSALDGTGTMASVVPLLPETAAALFTPAFFRQVSGREPGWFTRALDANTLDRWVPRAPLRLYNGSADEVVTPRDARRLHDFATRRGGRVTMHSLGAVEHQESSRRMYAPVRAWFDSLTAPRR